MACPERNKDAKAIQKRAEVIASQDYFIIDYIHMGSFESIFSTCPYLEEIINVTKYKEDEYIIQYKSKT